MTTNLSEDQIKLISELTDYWEPEDVISVLKVPIGKELYLAVVEAVEENLTTEMQRMDFIKNNSKYESYQVPIVYRIILWNHNNRK